MNKVVVTGCFQYFHQGHINLLSSAAKYGEVTVLLNSDAGVRSLKHYLGESEVYEKRKRLLLGSGFVHRVLKIFINPTMMIRFLKPDVLVAGNDHTEEEIMKKGGWFAKQIIILPYTKGICSTDIYKRNLNKDAR